jgi:RNA polymerase sigma-70 factor (ECF subfamily)
MRPTSETLAPEQDLIQAAQRGDKRAYGELVCLHWDGVVRVVYRMSGDPALAEDAAQEAFLRAWQRLSSYKPQHAFRAWVYKIAVNAALDVLRSRRPTGSLDDLADDRLPVAPEETGPAQDPESLVDRREQAERVQQAVMALPDASRAVLVLREWGQLSYAEIADALSIPIGTVMSRLNAGRGQLRKSLAGMMEEE